MLRRIRARLTYANVMATIGVFLALGGVGWAATQLPRNSVGSKQLKKNAVITSKIKKNAVNSAKVKNGSLKAGDFAPGQIPAGPTGPAGPAGEAVAYARVGADGTLEPANGGNENKNVVQANVQHAALGVYCFGGLTFTPTSIQATPDDATLTIPHFIVSAIVSRGANLNGCDATHQQARVTVVDVDGGTGAPAAYTPPALNDRRFFVWFEK